MRMSLNAMIRAVLPFVVIAWLLTGCDWKGGGPSGTGVLATNGAWTVYFSPRGGCTDAIVQEMDRATNSVLVQAYSFTSAPIGQALVSAHRRGINVTVILDDSNLTDKYSGADFLAHGGIKVLIDKKHGIAHNKVMVIDGKIVVTGSFNFTKAAEERNAENVLILRDSSLAQSYTENWQSHASHSEPYAGK